jgi:uncharacterized protein involved in exopolysaccharide biosynthesis
MTFFRTSPWRILVLRQARLMALVWGGCMLLGAAAIALKPSIYRAESKLYVRLGRENVTLDPTTSLGDGPVTILPQTRDAEMNSVVEILRSRVLLEEVADQITPERILDDQWSWTDSISSRGPARDAAVRKLGKMLTPASLRKSNLVLVSCDARNAELAKEATGIFVDRFLGYYRSLNRNPQAKKFFADQSELLRGKLQACEDEIMALKGTTGVVSIDVQQKLLLEQADAIAREVRAAEAEIGELEAAISVLRRRQETMPAMVTAESMSGAPNVAADSIRDRFFALELRERELSAKYTADHPLVKQVRDEVQGARRIYEREQGTRTQVTEGRSKGFEQVEMDTLKNETELKAAQSRLATRQKHLGDVRKELSDLRLSKAKLAELERQAELLKESYIKYSQSLEQTRIDESLENDRITNISVVEPPIANRRPVSPDRPLLAGLLLISATVAAAAVGLAAEAARSPGLLRHLEGHPQLDLASIS